MSRTNRIALLAAAVLLMVLAGTVFATRAPNTAEEPAQVTQDEDEAPPTAEELAHASERLADAGFTVPDNFADLATTYGLGGAVRLVAWSAESGTPIDEIAAKRDTGGTDGGPMGWGRIAKELGVHPGIGSIMGNGNASPGANAPGQEKHESDDTGG